MLRWILRAGRLTLPKQDEIGQSSENSDNDSSNSLPQPEEENLADERELEPGLDCIKRTTLTVEDNLRKVGL